MKPFFLFSFWGLLAISAFCQTDPLTQSHGARSQGLGNSRLNQRDSWAFFNHIGGLDRIEQSELRTGYDARFGLKELNTFSLSGALKNQKGTIGFGISRFGGKLFNQHLMGIGYSNTLGIASLGAKIEWFQTQIEGFGTGNSLVISFGGLAELGPKTFFGANISNINRGKFGKNSDQRLPTTIQMGLSYLPSMLLSTFVEIEKEVDSSPIVKAGIEYRPIQWISIRTGVSSNPTRVSFGLGIQKDRFGFDYAYGQNTALGRTHHLSLGLKLGAK